MAMLARTAASPARDTRPLWESTSRRWRSAPTSLRGDEMAGLGAGHADHGGRARAQRRRRGLSVRAAPRRARCAAARNLLGHHRVVGRDVELAARIGTAARRRASVALRSAAGSARSSSAAPTCARGEHRPRVVAGFVAQRDPIEPGPSHRSLGLLGRRPCPGRPCRRAVRQAVRQMSAAQMWLSSGWFR